VKEGHMEARAYTQNEIFEAAQRFAQTQGFIPGPEPAHAIRAVIEEAEAAKEAGEERVILFNLSGHGFFDMQAYDDYLNGRLPEVEYEDAALEEGLRSVPEVPIPG
jgi:tryptophan synthase beta chain